MGTLGDYLQAYEKIPGYVHVEEYNIKQSLIFRHGATLVETVTVPLIDKKGHYTKFYKLKVDDLALAYRVIRTLQMYAW